MWAAGQAVVGLAQAVEGPVHTWGRSMRATYLHARKTGGPATAGGPAREPSRRRQTQAQRRLTAEAAESYACVRNWWHARPNV